MTVRYLTTATLEALNLSAISREQKSQIRQNLKDIDRKLRSDPFLVMKCNFFLKDRFNDILQETIQLQADPLDVKRAEVVLSATTTLTDQMK